MLFNHSAAESEAARDFVIVTCIGGPAGDESKRNIAGVHWRSDYVESLKLGEQIAISVLRDQRMTYVQDFDGYTFTRFDGTRITV